VQLQSAKKRKFVGLYVDRVNVNIVRDQRTHRRIDGPIALLLHTWGEVVHSFLQRSKLCLTQQGIDFSVKDLNQLRSGCQ